MRVAELPLRALRAERCHFVQVDSIRAPAGGVRWTHRAALGADERHAAGSLGGLFLGHGVRQWKANTG